MTETMEGSPFAVIPGPRREGPGLPIAPCGGNLKRNKTFSGWLPEHRLVGQQDKGTAKS
jgi:hypothetical protein